MKVLYIGGTGEISHACVRRSVEVGQDVTVFNRGQTDEPLPDGVRRIVGDLSDAAAYDKLGDGQFDVVCQFLAYQPERIEADLAAFGGKCGQYVFISSASAYQKPPQGYVITEDVPLVNPYWAYSRAKAEMEARLMALHADDKLPVTVVRPSHTYRRRFPGGLASGYDWAWRFRQGRPAVIYGDGTSLWTLTHAGDFAVPFVNLLGNDRALGEAFHITRHMQAHTWNEIYAGIARAVGAEADLVHVATDTLIRYNGDWAGPLLGDKMWSVLFDNSKVISVAGEFECAVSLEEGFGRVAEHYLAHVEPTYQPDPQLHALIDRIAAEQSALGR